MTYDQQKREAIANAKHLVELLQEISDEHPGTGHADRHRMQRLANAVISATADAMLIIEREANPQ